MFKFRTVSILFLLFLAILILFDYFYSISWFYYLGVFLLYNIFIIWGSFNIRSQFYTTSINSFSTENKEVALTFDDGPENLVTSEILDILDQEKVKATFFCIGKKISGSEHVVKRIYEEGHSIGLHSHSHSYLYDFLPAKQVHADLLRNQETIEAVIGRKPICFRPPYGVTNPAIGKVMKRDLFHVLGWTVRSLDTVTKDETKILQRILRSIKPGAIILLHDHLMSTPGLLRKLLDELKAHDYKITHLPDALGVDFYSSNT